MTHSPQEREKAWAMITRLVVLRGRTPAERSTYIEKVFELCEKYGFHAEGRDGNVFVSRDKPKRRKPKAVFEFNPSKGLDLTDPTWSNMDEADGATAVSPADQARWVAEHYGKKK